MWFFVRSDIVLEYISSFFLSDGDGKDPRLVQSTTNGQHLVEVLGTPADSATPAPDTPNDMYNSINFALDNQVKNWNFSFHPVSKFGWSSKIWVYFAFLIPTLLFFFAKTLYFPHATRTHNWTARVSLKVTRKTASAFKISWPRDGMWQVRRLTNWPKTHNNCCLW